MERVKKRTHYTGNLERTKQAQAVKHQNIAANGVQPFITQFLKVQVPTLPLPLVSTSQTDLESDLECEMKPHGGNLPIVCLNKPERWL